MNMKKMYSLILFAAAALSLNGQNQQSPSKGFYSEAIPANRSEQHQANREPAAPTVQYTNDVIIENAPGTDQRRVRLSVAFNGWLYAAYNTVDSTGTKGGITIRMSRDNGMSWTTVDAYLVTDVRYPAFDIVVAGTDTNNLVLYVAGVNNNTASNSYVLYVDRYNATSGSFIGSNFNFATGTRPVYDVALASDYRFPAVGASPYSVGMLYSCYSSSYDSINYVGSIDGGATWSVRQSVSVTSGYNRGVSIAYGRSSSGSNGRYFAAWELLGSQNARNGHIYTSRSQSSVDGTWIAPVCLDSVSSTMINLCRQPQIATSFNNTDSDSGGVSAVVLVSRDYVGDGSDYDLLGFYNKRAHYSNYWNRLDVVNSGENDLQPDVTFDPANNNFLTVFYDSTNGKLPYLINDFNLGNPSTWTPITPQYNDVTNNLRGAWPRVEINQLLTQTAHVWIAEGANNKGVAMFDAEYNISSVHNTESVSISKLYPNPTANTLAVVYTVEEQNPVTITVYNMLGEIVESRQPLANGNGTFTENLDASNWANGIYTVTISCNGQVSSGRIVVAHP